MPESSSPLGPYWLLIDNSPMGPFDAATVQTMLAAGQVTLSTPARVAGNDSWAPLDSFVSNWSALPNQPVSTSAKTVLAPAPQETQAQTVPQSAASPRPSPRKRGRLVLFAGAAVLVSLIVIILAWPKDEPPPIPVVDGNHGKKGNPDDSRKDAPKDRPDRVTIDKKTNDSGKDEPKDHRLRRTNWIGKEQIHKTPTMLEIHFIDNKDVKKISKDIQGKVTLSGDYTVSGDTVTMTFRKKSGKIYERITYVGQIKDGTISGEARVDRGANWKFQVAQTGKKDAAN